MHEFHLVDGLVKEILQKARENQASRITRVRIVMGEMSELDEGSVRLYLEDLSAGTILEGAEITIRHKKAELACKPCGIEFERKKGEFNCPRCGQPAGPARSSGNLFVEDIEIEKA